MVDFANLIAACISNKNLIDKFISPSVYLDPKMTKLLVLLILVVRHEKTSFRKMLRNYSAFTETPAQCSNFLVHSDYRHRTQDV